MIRLILHEYRMKFSWKIIKNSLDNNEGQPSLLYMIVFPAWFAALAESSHLFLLLLLEIPLIINILMTRMYGKRLPKMMYLVPMEREERRQYLRTSGRLCFGIPMVLYLAAWILLGRIGRVNALAMAALLIVGVIFMLGNNLYMEGIYKDKEISEKVSGLKNYYGWMLGEKVYVIVILSICYVYGSTTNVVTGKAGLVITLLVCSVVGIFAELMRYSSQIGELALDYELSLGYEESQGQEVITNKKRKVRK